MEDQTCMEYLFDCVLSNRTENINQDILFNASNEFRNIWNLVKKLQDLARVDVQKITKFLDAVQEALGKKNWAGAARQCMQAENEYRQIRRYIRPSYLEDFKVSRFIEKGTTEKSAHKPDKKTVSASVNHVPKQNFRNHQINKQDIIKQDTATDGKPAKGSDTVNKDTGKNAEEKSVNSKKPQVEKHNKSSKQKEFMIDTNNINSLSNKQDNLVNSRNQKSSDNNGSAAQKVTDKPLNVNIQLNKEKNENKKKENVENVEIRKEQHDLKQETGSVKLTSSKTGEIEIIENGKTEISSDLKANKLNDETNKNDLGPDALKNEKKQSPNTSHDNENETENNQFEHSETKSDTKTTNNKKKKDETQTNEHMGDKSQALDISSLISERMTELGQDSNVEIIAVELTRIFEIDWKLAYKGLTECKPSNGMKNTIDFLSEILKDAVRRLTVHKAKERKTSKRIPTKYPVNSLLKTLKESFLTATLKELQLKFSVKYAKDTDGEYSVNIYAAKCVELAWFMFSKNPPMAFDYNSRPMLLEDLYQIYKPYKSEGKCIQYVVWPAIRQYVGGEIVAQGVADFR